MDKNELTKYIVPKRFSEVAAGEFFVDKQLFEDILYEKVEEFQDDVGTFGNAVSVNPKSAFDAFLIDSTIVFVKHPSKQR